MNLKEGNRGSMMHCLCHTMSNMMPYHGTISNLKSRYIQLHLNECSGD